MHLDFEELDHAPILINTLRKEEKKCRPFRFLEAWTTDYSSFSVIKNAWNKEVYNGLEWFKFNQRLRGTTRALKKGNREHFGFANKRIEKLEVELSDLHGKDASRDNSLKDKKVDFLVELRLK